MPDKPWFKPKQFGYGASPSTWQGWLATAIFILAIVLFPLWLRGLELAGCVALLGAAFVGLVYAKSSGQWRWRWGGR